MSATIAVRPASAARPAAWVRERGMPASILVAALSSAFGVLLITVTGYIGALLQADPFLSGSGTLAIVVAMLGAVLLGIAVYVAAIVTANTFATVVAGRTRQIALRRLIGASARSERRAVSTRGLGVGAIGAGLGFAVGLGLSALLVFILMPALDLHVDYGILTPTLLVPAVAVALTTWAAAGVGSRRVLDVTPREALGGSLERTSAEVRGRGRTTSAVVLLAVGFFALAAGLVAGLATPLGVLIAFLGGLASFTGLVLGATFIMPPILSGVGRLFGRSATARLAAENALRHPERSSRMAIGVVMGVALVTMFAVAGESAKSVLAASAGGEIAPEMVQVVDGFALVMMALVGVSAVIAAVGLVNLLTIGVVQRRRELGLLRALGFTSRQVRLMVLIEAAHISIASLLTGLVLGVLYGWIGAQATLGSVRVPPSFEVPTFVAPAVPWQFILAIVAATAVLTIVAAVVPTRLATRVVPVEAMQAD